MKIYLLFIFGNFDDREDIEFFCMQILRESPAIDSIRYVIENSKNIIVIFGSNYNKEKLSKEIYDLLLNENVSFYFLLERDSLVSAHIPETVKDFILKPLAETEIMNIEYVVEEKSMDIDQLLEKIQNKGIDSLTPEEKNFLDNFE
jgi:tyrosine-protein phosphatase YwqE